MAPSLFQYLRNSTVQSSSPNRTNDIFCIQTFPKLSKLKDNILKTTSDKVERQSTIYIKSENEKEGIKFSIEIQKGPRTDISCVHFVFIHKTL